MDDFAFLLAHTHTHRTNNGVPTYLPAGPSPMAGSSWRNNVPRSFSSSLRHFQTPERGLVTVPSIQHNTPYQTFLETGECEDDSLFIDVAAIGHMIAVVDGLRNSDGFLGSLSDWINGPLPGCQ